jgi:aspartate dehydrogenase
VTRSSGPPPEGATRGASALRVALIGWGAIAQRFAELVTARNPGRVEIVGVAARASDVAPYAALSGPEALVDLAADVVVEAAGREAVLEWGEAALCASKSFVVASTSALADEALLARFLRLAERNGGQLVIPPGALAGVDGLAAAARLGVTCVRHSIVKPPKAWKGTPADDLLDLDALSEATAFFAGSAREAARLYPQNANVAVISALAGVGLDKTEIRLVADPGVARNAHKIEAEGEFGALSMTIENRPLAANPKSSEMTALSLVRVVENRLRPICV